MKQSYGENKGEFTQKTRRHPDVIRDGRWKDQQMGSPSSKI